MKLLLAAAGLALALPLVSIPASGPARAQVSLEVDRHGPAVRVGPRYNERRHYRERRAYRHRRDDCREVTVRRRHGDGSVSVRGRTVCD